MAPFITGATDIAVYDGGVLDMATNPPLSPTTSQFVTLVKLIPIKAPS